MNEKEAISNILKNYDAEIIEVYKKITVLVKEEKNKIKRNEVRETIKDLIMGVVKNED